MAAMGRTAGNVAAVVALALAAFCLAYFGGGLLNKEPAAAKGAALQAPALAVDGTPVAMLTPTPTPTPTATPKPKKKHVRAKAVKRKRSTPKRKVSTAVTQTYRATPVPTRVATAVPTAVYRPPVTNNSSPKSGSGGSGKKKPDVIIED